ncbi:MAG: hypothetical protein JXA81_12740 [Sedimentisphaerales bacterium]|nr:hypothetical protein [Sedimentisphaerales bacterium]
MAEKLAIRLINMKYYLLIIAAVCVVLSLAGCRQETNACAKTEFAHPTSPPEAKDEAPLLLDDEPLLLLEGEPQADQSDGPKADNSRCFVCHINYMQEDIAVIHARASIGCASCHGESDEHIADESWASGGNGTAPDIMYLPAKINPFCMDCHTRDKIDTEQHKPLFANMGKMVCTDCHGSHRLEVRKCKWK